jgi:AP-4 complex subunit mu-1
MYAPTFFFFFKKKDRHDTPRDTSDLLLDRLKTWQKDHGAEQDPPPIFNVDGVNFLFTNVQGLYFVCTTKVNVSPFMIYELLGRIATLIKDFCGSLSEESLQLNSSLVYELLDEIIVSCDFWPSLNSSNGNFFC